jgi:hypothetical protein
VERGKLPLAQLVSSVTERGVEAQAFAGAEAVK